jgi:hypothetical protein
MTLGCENPKRTHPIIRFRQKMDKNRCLTFLSDSVYIKSSNTPQFCPNASANGHTVVRLRGDPLALQRPQQSRFRVSPLLGWQPPRAATFFSSSAAASLAASGGVRSAIVGRAEIWIGAQHNDHIRIGHAHW